MPLRYIISHCRTKLGLEAEPLYLTLRTHVQDYLVVNKIANMSSAGPKLWNKVLDRAMEHKSLASKLDQFRHDEEFRECVNCLCQDVAKRRNRWAPPPQVILKTTEAWGFPRKEDRARTADEFLEETDRGKRRKLVSEMVDLTEGDGGQRANQQTRAEPPDMELNLSVPSFNPVDIPTAIEVERQDLRRSTRMRRAPAVGVDIQRELDVPKDPMLTPVSNSTPTPRTPATESYHAPDINRVSDLDEVLARQALENSEAERPRVPNPMANSLLVALGRSIRASSPSPSYPPLIPRSARDHATIEAASAATEHLLQVLAMLQSAAQSASKAIKAMGGIEGIWKSQVEIAELEVINAMSGVLSTGKNIRAASSALDDALAGNLTMKRKGGIFDYISSNK